jgi:hypothetical protein
MPAKLDHDELLAANRALELKLAELGKPVPALSGDLIADNETLIAALACETRKAEAASKTATEKVCAARGIPLPKVTVPVGTATDRILKANGCKNLVELRAKRELEKASEPPKE